MKKLCLIIAASFALVSCGGNNGASKVSNESAAADTIVASADSTVVTGIAVDGAMNSILLRTVEGDTLSFGYPELPTDKRYGWSIGDTVSVSYIKSSDGNIQVLSLEKGNLK